jgi:hypothetical protein
VLLFCYLVFLDATRQKGNCLGLGLDMNIPAMLRKIIAALVILLWLSPLSFTLAADGSADYFGGEKLKVPDPVRNWDTVKPTEHVEFPLWQKASAYSTSLHTVADQLPFRKETKRATNAKTNLKLFKLEHAFRI